MLYAVRALIHVEEGDGHQRDSNSGGQEDGTLQCSAD